VQEVTSIQHYLDTLSQRFQPDAARGMSATYQFQLIGDGATDFHITVNDGAFTVAPGVHPSPTATMKISAADHLKLVNGQLSGQRAYLTGRMKVSGNIPAFMKLQKILPAKE